MRSPFLTFVSEGKPLRRLLVISKKWSIFMLILLCHILSELRVNAFAARRNRRAAVQRPRALSSRDPGAGSHWVWRNSESSMVFNVHDPCQSCSQVMTWSGRRIARPLNVDGVTVTAPEYVWAMPHRLCVRSNLNDSIWFVALAKEQLALIANDWFHGPSFR
jgi:hypothetical protein